MYNENDFEYIDLDDESNIDLKTQLEIIIADNFEDDFVIYNCCYCKNESKVFYCYFGYEDDDTYYVKIDFNNNTIKEIDNDNDELKEIIFCCSEEK